MLIRDVKPIWKLGRNFLEKENTDDLIYKIIEKPLQKACKECKEKNIETVMSSANKNNIMTQKSKIVNKKELNQMLEKHKIVNLICVGKGYAWIMINYNTLSNKNREIFFLLENELGEDRIWFVKENFTDAKNYIRRKLKLKEIQQVFTDKYADEFRKRQVKLAYKYIYPTRNVFVRMPIDKNTQVEDVSSYFCEIISKLEKQ